MAEMNDVRQTGRQTGKHTPGPWMLHEKLSGSGNHRGWNVRGRDGIWLAELSPINTRDGEPSDEGRANTHLIVNAPETLSALKDAREAIRAMFNEEATSPLQALIDADLAIAKAEGR